MKKLVSGMHTYTSFSFITAILLATIFGVGPTTAHIAGAGESATLGHNAQHIGDYRPTTGNNATNGLLNWRYTTGDALWSSPAVANGIVYIGSADHNVYAINATIGAKVWSYKTGDSVLSDLTFANGIVYVGSDDNNVYALNARTGELVWSFLTDDFVESSPVVVNHIVYVGSADNNVYALGEP